MKKIIAVVITCLVSLAAYQTVHAGNRPAIDTVPPNRPPQLEKDAAFKEGKDAWSTFVARNLNGTVPVKKGAPPGSYMVAARFIIDTLGNIDKVMIVKDPGYGMADETIRVIQLSSGKWLPAVVKGGGKIKAMRAQTFIFNVAQQ